TWLGFFAACWIISLSPGAGAIAQERQCERIVNDHVA
ncbi:hypothetical protein PSYPI_48420, partial [Pseudomonas syringae pv. pisi str. 1704B]